MSYLISVFSAVEPSKLVRKVHPLVKEKKHAELFGFEAVYVTTHILYGSNIFRIE